MLEAINREPFKHPGICTICGKLRDGAPDSCRCVGRPAGVLVDNYREGRSHCHYCSSNGSLGVHAAVNDPAWRLMVCHACSACFWITETEFARLMYDGPLVLPAPGRIVPATHHLKLLGRL